MIKQLCAATAILMATVSTGAIACPNEKMGKDKTAGESNMSKPAVKYGKAGQADKAAAGETSGSPEKAVKPKV